MTIQKNGLTLHTSERQEARSIIALGKISALLDFIASPAFVLDRRHTKSCACDWYLTQIKNREFERCHDLVPAEALFDKRNEDLQEHKTQASATHQSVLIMLLATAIRAS